MAQNEDYQNEPFGQAFAEYDAQQGMPSNDSGGTADQQEALNRGANGYAGGDTSKPVNYSNDALSKYNASAPWTGAGGQGYYDPRTGQTYNFQNAPQGSLKLDRPGIDKRVQGNLEDPYAGYYGGAPGVAESEEQRYGGLANAARNQPGAQINNGQYNADRQLELGDAAHQQYALDRYQDLIEGRGTSVAQQQMNQGLASAMAQQQAIAASARGGGANLVAAQQSAANAAGNLSGQANSQAALLRAQEVQGALAGYSGLATQQRAADLQRQGLSADQAYKQAQLEEQQHAINAQTGLGYEGLRQGVFQDQQKGMEYNESENQNAYEGGTGLGEQQAARQQQETNNYVQGGVTTGAALITALSDVRQKDRIGDGAPAVRQQMGAMSPQTYQYRNPGLMGAGPGQRVGVMAQDMERGPYGHQLVKNTPEGKKIDGPGGLSLALASGADHEQRLRALEGAAIGAVGKGAREKAYDAWYAERQRSPGYGAAQAAQAADEQRRRNTSAFRSFVPESSIQLPPQQPTGLARAAQIQAAGYR